MAEDISLLSSLGELVTIQIDLTGAEQYSEKLREKFNDSEDRGLYIDDMVLQRIMDNRSLDYENIFEDIVEIIGDYEAIDSITALLRIEYKGDPVEITVQLLGGHQAPQILNVTNQSNYFEITQLVQTRWQFAKAKLN